MDIELNIDDELLEKATVIAEYMKITLNDLIILALEYYINKNS